MSDTVPNYDHDPQITYAAVGEALSMWECMEYRLAELYTIFRRAPYDMEALKQFANTGKIFSQRLAALRRARFGVLQRRAVGVGAGKTGHARAADRALRLERSALAVQPGAEAGKGRAPPRRVVFAYGAGRVEQFAR